ncbi:MAG: VOC family protein [Synergistaceae bacterium]|jgi:lactoylglutathione lyase|nr:VOC family protein [Synergistaceae bacterium]
MKYSLVTLQVLNPDPFVDFFHGIMKMPIAERYKIDDGEIVFLGSAGEPMIELVASPRGKDMTYTGFSIGFDVPSLKETTALLEGKGYLRIKGPISPNPAVVFSFFSGPGGIEIEILEYKKQPVS